MRDARVTTERREDSFLSSRGIDQSTVIMVGAILVVALLLLSLLGRGTTDLTPAATSDATATESVVTESVEPAVDIAGSVDTVTDSN